MESCRRAAVVLTFLWLFLSPITEPDRLLAQTGGFIESAASLDARRPLSADEIKAFLPSRGRFTFPAPYETTAARLTNGGDCGGGDCVNYVGYSYWRNINNHAGSNTMLVFLGLSRQRGGAGPTLFTYDKTTGETRNAGPLFGAASPYSWATAEGWYFSPTMPRVLYMNDGPRMLRYDVVAKSFQTVFDLRDHLGSGRWIWQMHSSNDDRVHSATVKDSTNYQNLGCVAYREDTRRLTFIAAKGEFDECQIDKSGRWLVIKENVDGRYGEDNRIIDLQTGAEQVFLDEEGAAGHSDVGHGYFVAEDNFHSMPGAVRVWRLGEDMKAAGQGTLVYAMTSWDVGGVGQLAHGNASAATPAAGQMACSSSAHRRNEPRVNEIVCYLLDGSLNVLVVAPNLTNLDATGGGGEYEKRPKGNLDVTGEYFIWTANAGTSRLDAFIVHVPKARLDGGIEPEPTPEPAPAPPASIALAAAGYKVKGSQKADLSWSGAGGTSVEVYRNGAMLTTTPNDGAHVDHIDRKGSGRYTYTICEAGTSRCSNQATVSF